MILNIFYLKGLLLFCKLFKTGMRKTLSYLLIMFHFFIYRVDKKIPPLVFLNLTKFNCILPKKPILVKTWLQKIDLGEVYTQKVQDKSKKKRSYSYTIMGGGHSFENNLYLYLQSVSSIHNDLLNLKSILFCGVGQLSKLSMLSTF